MKSLVLTLLLAAASAAGAQDIGPRGELIAPRLDTLEIFLVRGADTTQTGVLLDEIALVKFGDRMVLRRVYQSEDQVLGARLDTIFDDAVTLLPISYRSRTSRSLEFLDFGSERVTGWMRLANGDSVAVNAPVGGRFYNSSSFDLILRAAPLRSEWVGVVSAFLPSTRSIVQFDAKVEGTDTVDGEPAWKVQANFGGTPVTFWIGKESRRLKRQVMQVRPDVAILFARPRIVSTPKRAT